MTDETRDHNAQLQLEKFARSTVNDALRDTLDLETLFSRLFMAETFDARLQALERLALDAADSTERPRLLRDEPLARARETVALTLATNPVAERAQQAIVDHEETKAALRERMSRAIGAQLGELRGRMGTR